jgi:hypothetical protein
MLLPPVVLLFTSQPAASQNLKAKKAQKWHRKNKHKSGTKSIYEFHKILLKLVKKAKTDVNLWSNNNNDNKLVNDWLVTVF